ncbi:hypothetical protein [Caulobacter sp. BP25]|uniref:hypothetical protein n=1 Tax=Caulobacter sp. BP25 TaxID=2048900 RepID=UPI00191BA021|nr:hypothetical protein [Caulobacter sp. BP25]
MTAIYADEVSQMQVGKIVLPFLVSNITNFFKRLFYSYVLRNFSVASLYFLVGVSLTLFGVIRGAQAWMMSVADGKAATSGQVMLAPCRSWWACRCCLASWPTTSRASRGLDLAAPLAPTTVLRTRSLIMSPQNFLLCLGFSFALPAGQMLFKWGADYSKGIDGGFIQKVAFNYP